MYQNVQKLIVKVHQTCHFIVSKVQVAQVHCVPLVQIELTDVNKNPLCTL